MCTASWLSRPDGYELFFNRDERRTRLPALPPAVRLTGGRAYLAPLDGDALGTWIAVDADGVSLALLNGFPDGPPPDESGTDWISRGHVIPDLVGSGSAAAALERLRGLPLSRFRPMLVLALDPAGGCGLGDWSGRELTVRRGDRAPAPPLISSSFCSAAVRASRLRVWHAVVGRRAASASSAPMAFHRSHQPSRGPRSVCMHRPDARTVSFTRIVVDRSSVSLRYTPDAPCRGTPLEALRLARGSES